MGITTTGLTSLLTGEAWHYVGATDEPAFNSTWANISALPKLAFRSRETGIVDIQGTVTPGASATSGTAIFTLPTGYRPTVLSYIPIVTNKLGTGTEGSYIVVGADGVVTPYYDTTGPQVYIYAQVFLDTPAVA